MVHIAKCAKMDFSVMLWHSKSLVIHLVVKYANAILLAPTMIHRPCCPFVLPSLETVAVNPMLSDATVTGAKMATLTSTVVKDAILAIVTPQVPITKPVMLKLDSVFADRVSLAKHVTNVCHNTTGSRTKAARSAIVILKVQQILNVI